MRTALALIAAALLALLGLAAGDAVAHAGLFVPGAPFVLAIAAGAATWCSWTDYGGRGVDPERRRGVERRRPVRPDPAGHLFTPWPNKPDECTYCYGPRPGHLLS